MNPNRYRAILMIRLSAIGDIIMASPLIRAMRQRYPTAQLVWLVQEEYAALLTAHSQLDAVIAWPKQRWIRLFRQRRWLTLLHEISAFIRLLRHYQFDLALDVQGLFKSAIWAWISGAKRRIGINAREGSQWLMTEVLSCDRNQPRISSEYRQLAAYLDLATEPFALDIEIAIPDQQEAADLLRQVGIRGDFIAFCPFTTRPQKHWPWAHWIALSQRLREKMAWPCIVLGGSHDQAVADELVAHSKGAITAHLAGRTSLPQAIAVLSKARLVIGVDTGLTHGALSQRVPTIALFGSTRPYQDTGISDSRVLYQALPCSPCRRHPTCGGAYTCMHLITEAEVLLAVDSLKLLRNQPATSGR